MIIVSSLGGTNCYRSRVFYRSNKLFAQHMRTIEDGEPMRARFVSLPIVVAVLASPAHAEQAVLRVLEARRDGENVVDLTDLEDS